LARTERAFVRAPDSTNKQKISRTYSAGISGPPVNALCDQAIFVDQATDASVSSDAILIEVCRLG
jgi:hypothetical protein